MTRKSVSVSAINAHNQTCSFPRMRPVENITQYYKNWKRSVQ